MNRKGRKMTPQEVEARQLDQERQYIVRLIAEKEMQIGKLRNDIKELEEDLLELEKQN